MSYCNLSIHLVYGVWLLDKGGYCLEDPCPEGRGLKSKTLEENGLVLVEFSCMSRWVFGIDDSHQLEDCLDNLDIGQKLEANPEWSEKLLAYCRRYRIKSSKDPEWRILSYYEKDSSVISKYDQRDYD